MAEVLPVQIADGQPYYTSSSLRRSPSSQTSLFIGTPPYSPRKSSKYVAPAASADSYPGSSSNSSSSSSRTSQIDLTTASSSFASTVASSLTLDTSYDLHEDINFPTYNGGGYMDPYEDDEPPSPRTDNSYTVPSPTTESNPTHTPDSHLVAEDDTAIRQHPSRHVDYLSHDWREEDIWSSWRHIVSQRRVYGERSRLENASWRTWTKQKNKLRTIPPDSLNWLKDCDVTWLYGPLQTATNYTVSQPAYLPPSYLSRTNSHANFGQDIDEVKKKPILKKRSMSEVMLQKSISASSLVKQAAAAVQAERDLSRLRSRDDRPMFGRAASDFVTSAYPSQSISRDTVETLSSSATSSLQTPDQGEKRHIRFADKVEQCIAIDGKGNDDDDEPASYQNNDSDSDDSDDGVLMMSTKTNRKKPISRSNSKTDLSEKTLIVNLEPTTLKYRTDSPDVPEHPSHSVRPSLWGRSNISPSPSQETLRPAHPSRNFLLEDDDDENDLSWEPSGAFADRHGGREEDDDESHSGGLGGMRRTASGMLMPYEEGDEAQNSGLFGKVVDTVNTAKDIAHVIWNVGWRP